MIVTPSPYVAAFLAAVPTAFLQDVLDLVFKAYMDAFDHCEQAFQEREAHDLRPIYRRALIEQDLRAAAQRHGYSGAGVLNDKKTSTHTEVAIGSVVITHNTLPSRLEMVRPAVFRSGLALEYQLVLVPPGEAQPQLDDQRLYALIVTGEERRRPAIPAFVDVVFPNKTFTNYMGRLNLIEHLKGAGVTPTGATASVPAPNVKRRRVAKRRAGAKGSA